MKRPFTILLSVLSLIGVSAGRVAFAQTQITIATSVPGNYGAAAAASSPGAFIANFYIFSLIIGGVLAFGIIVYGGVKYMASAGNPSGQGDAKEWIEAALLGLLLLVGAYFILDVINPQLLNLNLPTLTALNITAPSAGSSTGGSTIQTGKPNQRCTAPPAGQCSVANLQKTCMGSNAAIAGGVCQTESSNNVAAGGDLSTNIDPKTGKYLPASVGLFQINLSANTIPYTQNGVCPPNSGCLNCPDAFSNKFTGSNPHTTITNMTLYNQCVAAAENPTTNIQQACAMSNNGKKWSQWGPSTLNACGLTKS